MSQKVNDDNTMKKEKKESLCWTSQMDYAFILGMRKEQDRGYMIDGAFTSQAYSNMVGELSRNLNIDLNKNHLKNRLKTIKGHFAQYYDIFRGVSLSGFSWNPESNLLEAEDEVWAELIAQPRTTGLNHQTLKLLKYWTWQFVVTRPTCSFLMIGLQLLGMYPSWVCWTFTIILNISFYVAMYSLVVFYHVFAKELNPHKPLAKFLCIKGIVFFCYWQQYAFHFVPYNGDVQTMSQKGNKNM